MASIKKDNNRRKHKRYNIGNGGFALLRNHGKEVLGSIRDISSGGLCLSYMDEEDTIDNNSRITINLVAENIYYEKYSGRSIWSQKEKDGFSTALVKMKSRGIQFEHLSEKMQAQLNKFIDWLMNK